ncbi:GntR family transcriptional regulator [Robbsia sp. KACC 23696]|uniref:GntR family transcriptional regulator n=1 Tax=Robbsia sp. KACC 23696 TaxID=3149231 RepID=UPI00325B0CF5
MGRTLAMTRPRTLAGVVTERLRAAIVDGEFAPGELLSEDALAAQLGTSRTPVREALNTLQFQGLVNIVPQRGTFVFSPTDADIAELCDYRATLEMKAVQLAMARHPDAAHRDLKAALADMTRAHKKHDDIAYARADSAFHETFLTHCDNPYLKNAYLLASGRVAAVRCFLASHVTGEPARSFDEHREIVKLWGEGDGQRIATILAAHIMRTQENYLRALKAGTITTQTATTPTRRASALKSGLTHA